MHLSYRSGLLSNTQKWTVWGDAHIDEARDFIVKGFPRERAVGWRPRLPATWLIVLSLMLMGVVSGFPRLTQDPSWWCTPGSAKMDSSGEDSGGLEMATHSSILAWRIPWAEEPGRLQLRVAKSQIWLSDWMQMRQMLNSACYMPGMLPSAFKHNFN